MLFPKNHITQYIMNSWSLEQNHKDHGWILPWNYCIRDPAIQGSTFCLNLFTYEMSEQNILKRSIKINK